MAIYKDINFELTEDPVNGIDPKTDDQAVTQSIKNILFTEKGEIPFDPLFGSGVRKLLFEKMSPITEMLLSEEIENALNNFEPRIEINNIKLTPNYSHNKYEVYIDYTIIYLDQEEFIKLDFNLQGI